MQWILRHLLTVLEYFWLRNAERAVDHLSTAVRVFLRSEHEAAVALMRAADRLSLHSERVHLARQATLRLAEAVRDSYPRTLQQRDQGRAWATVEFLAAIPQLSAHRTAIAELWSTDTSRFLAMIKYEQLTRLFGELEAMLDTRTPRDFLLARVARTSMLALALVIVGWLLLGPRNLARGATIYTSSISGETPAEPLGEARLHRVVDGIHQERPFALGTNTQTNPWVTVDLGRVHRIKRVVVYGRTGRQYGAGFPPEEFPVTLSFSIDQKKYEPALTRETPIAWEFPWKVELYGVSARYIRLSSQGAQPKRIVVSEIEVYGR